MADRQISDKHPDYTRRIVQWLKIRDSLEGEEVSGVLEQPKTRAKIAKVAKSLNFIRS